MPIIVINPLSWTLLSITGALVNPQSGPIDIISAVDQPADDAESELVLQAGACRAINPVLPIWGRPVLDEPVTVGTIGLRAAPGG